MKKLFKIIAKVFWFITKWSFLLEILNYIFSGNKGKKKIKFKY